MSSFKQWLEWHDFDLVYVASEESEVEGGRKWKIKKEDKETAYLGAKFKVSFNFGVWILNRNGMFLALCCSNTRYALLCIKAR